MKNKWYKIFNDSRFFYNRESNKIKYLNKNYSFTAFKLCEVIYPELTYKKFTNIIKFQISNLMIKKNYSILDFGSGNGAFLYYFKNKFNLKNNYSFEVSRPLLNFQKKILKETFFIQTHYKHNNSLRDLKDNMVDYSICNSVFQYFPSEIYARNVLEFLIRISRKSILIYDIKNLRTKKTYKEKVRKRQRLNNKDFIIKYKNTPIRFYKKSYFEKILGVLKKKYSFEYKFLKLPIDATDYKFGYCLLIRK
tara:strand:+ start:880 stop:1629 length:750 start_codon:yes stop_codon:yes gene_type:complete